MEVVVYLYGKTDFVNTLRDCANGCNVMFGHNMFFYITNCLHEQGTAARRITNKKVGKQKFCIENLLPDFNF